MTQYKRVLLTGITGFVGSHTAIQLLQKGFHVTGTLRDLKRAGSIRTVISQQTSEFAQEVSRLDGKTVCKF